MRKIFIFAIAATILSSCSYQPSAVTTSATPYEPTPSDVSLVFSNAADYTLVGKLMDTPNPFHRVDTVEFKGFTEAENRQVRMSSGIAVAFKTNSGVIAVRPEYGYAQTRNDNPPISDWGFNLYIKRDGEWLYAASATNSTGKASWTMT